MANAKVVGRVSMIAVLISACGAQSEEPAVAGHEVVSAYGESSTRSRIAAHVGGVALTTGTRVSIGAPIPSTLTCVSAVLDPAVSPPQVLRLEIDAASASVGSASVSLAYGPQFRTHDGSSTAIDAPSAARTLTVDRVVSTAGISLAEGARFGVHIDLARDPEAHDAVFRGTFVDDECYSHVEAAITCWNATELFGSPWTGVASKLPARFDRSTGRCVDSSKNAALNRLPIEVVRETGRGDCADLRGVSLNGDDLAGPHLEGWSLVGANLGGARLFFASLDFASLEGADLSGLELGYATLSGTFDAHTVLPTDTTGCTITKSPWSGDSVSCTR